MALETKIPTEIDDYAEKLVFGLTMRQFLCLLIAAAAAIGTWFLLTAALNLSSSITSYVIMAEAIPIMAIGFIKKDGLTFERYISLLLRQIVQKNIFCNTTEGATKNVPSKETAIRPKTEYTNNHMGDHRRRRANTKARIHTAQQQHRSAQQAAQRASQK